MNKTELLKTLEETVPALQGKLHIERVLYKKAANKAYMSFLCDDLVGETDYLLLEKTLRRLFPKLTVALRVASPGLAEDFCAHIDRYKPVLTDFLRRQSPALSAWIDDVGWTAEEGRILLTCPDNICLSYFKSRHLDEKLSRAVYDIFRVRLPITMTVCGQREEWVKQMRQERGFHYAPAPMDEPPPLDDAALEAQAAAMTGALPRSASPKPKAQTGVSAAAPSRAAKEDVLKGRAIADHPVPIGELAEDSGIVVVEGVVTGVNDPRELKGGETVLATFAVYDDTSTIYCKAFYQYRMKRRGMGEEPTPPTDEERQRVADQIKQIQNGMKVRLRGECRMDPFLGELSIGVRDMQKMPKAERMDNAEEKRIELHMHTTMSTMDATADAGD